MNRILVLLLVASLAANGWLVWNQSGQSELIQPDDRLPDKKYEYLSQRIFVENPNDIFVGMMPLRTALYQTVEQSKDKISLYFEYLPSGASIGINEKEEYPLASLFKVPVVMLTMMRIEQGKESWDRELVLTEDIIDRNFGDWWKKGIGAKVTVSEAIEAAVTQSDNTAHFLLMKNLSQNEITDLYRDLDFTISQTNEGPAFIGSVKGYSSIFRALYLSSFLTEENSNRLLELLTHTIYTDRIPAGVRSGIKVAHKIGVFEITDLGSMVYSDCGIIYEPKRPYILCMMAEGNEEDTRNLMQKVARMVDEFIVKVN